MQAKATHLKALIIASAACDRCLEVELERHKAAQAETIREAKSPHAAAQSVRL